MFSRNGYPMTRTALHGFAILGMLIAMMVNVPSAYAAPPVNDAFSKAIKISGNSYSQTIQDATTATQQPGDPVLSCIGEKGKDTLWWTFVPGGSGGDVRVSTANSAYDTAVAIFMDDPLAPGSLIEMGCNDNAGSSVTSQLNLTLRGGVRYYIEVVRKSTWAPTPPDALRISFSYTSKVVAFAMPGGKIWDSSADGLFTFTSTGWQLIPYLGAYKNAIHLSNNRNNTATAYFDGGSLDLNYFIDPQMGQVNLFIDDVLVGTVNQGEGLAGPATWTSPPLSDNVHKFQLTHITSGKKANFDTITVYPFPDALPPDPINNPPSTEPRPLDLDGKDTGGAEAVCGDTVAKVILTWKAPGDDFAVGTATRYRVRYSLNPILAPADWAAATPITSGVPKPAVAGTTQTMTVTGLVPGLLYHFNVRAQDEAGNLGDLSYNCSAVLNSGQPPVGAGMYDDKHVGWTYSGNWTLVNNPDAYANTQHVSSKIGSAAVFGFTGRQFVLYYKRGPAMGKVDVFIDGLYYDTIDQYSFYPDGRNYPGPILTLGPHIVRFVQATAIQSNVDAILISNKNDGGKPDPIIDLAAIPGAADGTIDLTWTATGDDPGGVGRATQYQVRMSNRPILTDDDWYSAKVAPGVVPLPQVAGSAEMMTVTNLVQGAEYWFAVRAFDNAYFYSDLSNTANAVSTYSGVYEPAGPYQDTHASWQYYGIWNTANIPQAWGGTQHQTTLVGSSAVFHFNGSGFTLTFSKGPSFSKLIVYVDGVHVGSINQKYDAKVYKRTQTFDGFAPGNHVVQFAFEGGERVNIDAITILP